MINSLGLYFPLNKSHFANFVTPSSAETKI